MTTQESIAIDLENRMLSQGASMEDYLAKLDALLESRGYTYDPAAPCICGDEGKHGHLPHCGWSSK